MIALGTKNSLLPLIQADNVVVYIGNSDATDMSRWLRFCRNRKLSDVITTTSKTLGKSTYMSTNWDIVVIQSLTDKTIYKGASGKIHLRLVSCNTLYMKANVHSYECVTCWTVPDKKGLECTDH